MPRPARFTVDELLDAAARLVADGGPGAVTMSAVARATGAPSGSLYHRFPTRATLCGELWTRTEQRFQAGFADALTVPGDPAARCVGAALFVVQFCREHPEEAQVLLSGPDALCAAEWPDALTAQHRKVSRALRRLLAAVPGDTERVTAAVTEIPYAVVRRHLRARQPIPAGADAIVADCARALLTN